MELVFGSLIWEAGKLPARVREGEGGVCSRVGWMGNERGREGGGGLDEGQLGWVYTRG